MRCYFDFNYKMNRLNAVPNMGPGLDTCICRDPPFCSA